MDIDLEQEIKDVEERIIEWAKLIGNCKPDSMRFSTRVEMIKYVIEERAGLKGLLVRGDKE